MMHWNKRSPWSWQIKFSALQNSLRICSPARLVGIMNFLMISHAASRCANPSAIKSLNQLEAILRPSRDRVWRYLLHYSLFNLVFKLIIATAFTKWLNLVSDISGDVIGHLLGVLTESYIYIYIYIYIYAIQENSDWWAKILKLFWVIVSNFDVFCYTNPLFTKLFTLIIFSEHMTFHPSITPKKTETLFL